MPAWPIPENWIPRVVLLGYSGLLAAVAGFVNSVALLVWAFPVGHLTALTTKAGMHRPNPLIYQGRMIAVIVFGFLVGAVAAGAVLAAVRTFAGPRHAAILLAEAALLLAALASSTLSAGRCLPRAHAGCKTE